MLLNLYYLYIIAGEAVRKRASKLDGLRNGSARMACREQKAILGSVPDHQFVDDVFNPRTVDADHADINHAVTKKLFNEHVEARGRIAANVQDNLHRLVDLGNPVQLQNTLTVKGAFAGRLPRAHHRGCPANSDLGSLESVRFLRRLEFLARVRVGRLLVLAC